MKVDDGPPGGACGRGEGFRGLQEHLQKEDFDLWTNNEWRGSKKPQELVGGKSPYPRTSKIN